jgi:hypothetical protein
MVRLLFIGNSFTARNDLPGLLAQLAAARLVLKHHLISAGGASFACTGTRESAQGDRGLHLRLRNPPGAEHSGVQESRAHARERPALR